MDPSPTASPSHRLDGVIILRHAHARDCLDGVVSVGASYSALVFCQYTCRQHQKTLIHCKSCQAISSMRVALFAKTVHNAKALAYVLHIEPLLAHAQC